MIISVIIPVYNKEDFVEKCIESALHQDFTSYEVIAVDDGSSDHSGRICDALALTDQRLKVVHAENGGVTCARRTGVAHAQGEYIMFLDADDQLLPDALSATYAALKTHDVDEVIAPYQNQRGELFDAGCQGLIQSVDVIKNYLATYNSFQSVCGILFKKSLLEGCFDFSRDIIIGEDILAHIRVLVKQPKAYYLEKSIYIYNQGLPNTRKKTLAHEMLFDEILKASLQPLWDELKTWFTRRQIKTYECFLDERAFHVYREYYCQFKKDVDKSIPLLDRIVFALPPKIAYLPVHFYKKWLRRKSKQIFDYYSGQ